jgi:uncharacterized membrane protein
MRLRLALLVALVVLAAAAMVMASSAGSDNPATAVLRVVVALPLVFVSPGYAIVAIFFPSREPGPLARLALSVGLSLVLCDLGGFILNWMPLGLTRVSWVLLLGWITIVAGVVAIFRSLQLAQAPSVQAQSDPSAARLGLLQAALLGLALLITVGATQFICNSVEQNSAFSFTQLWLLPGTGTPASVRVGIANMETRPVQYRLQVKQGQVLIGEWPVITVAHNQRWEIALPLLPDNAGEVEALLYRLDMPETIYRQAKMEARVQN